MNLRTIDSKIKSRMTTVSAFGLDVKASKWKKNAIIPICEDVVEAINPKIDVFDGRIPNRKAIARYIDGKEIIEIPHKKFFKSPVEYYMILFHEIAHFLATKIGRQLGGGEIKRATEELTAQLTSCYLLNLLGIHSSKIERHTAKYLLLFNKGNLKTAQTRAKKMARLIIGFCAKKYAYGS